MDLFSLIDWNNVDWDKVGALATVAAIVFAIPGFLLGLRSIRRGLTRIEHQNEEGVAALKKLALIRRVSDGDQNALWSRPLSFDGIDEYHSLMESAIPIVTFMNFKGGVGKTTIAGNFAADCSAKGERVLAIDLDYQGSLSSLFLGHARITDEQTLDESQQLGAQILQGQHDGNWLKMVAKAVSSDLPKLKYIPTTYDLADVENRLMIKWLIDESNGDVRLYLAKILLSADIQESYDRIIIDTGPRPTTAMINALCTSTHFVLPTILDSMSASSVRNTLSQVKRLKPVICPHINFVGIIGSMTTHQDPGKFSANEQPVIGELRSGATQAFGHGDHFLDNCNVGDQAAIAVAAGKKLAYFENGTSRTMFEALGEEIRRRAPSKTS
ncbi:MAG: AAA family ATPase [Hyphomicrobiaceae bacterium]